MGRAVASIGYIGELVEQRTRELVTAGFAVTEARNFVQARALLRGGRFDVVVLGHSVPEPERTLLALEAKRSDPGTCIVFLYLTEIRRAELADAVINVTSGHGDLVRTMKHLLQQRDRAAAG